MEAVLLFSDEEHDTHPNSVIDTSATLRQLHLVSASTMTFTVRIPTDGTYAMFTEHRPQEFAIMLRNGDTTVSPSYTNVFKPDHEHDDEVSSVGITVPGDLDPNKLNTWLSNLLRTQGTDIFRMKGVLSIKNEQQRFVFQGVHMLFDGRPDREWGDEQRTNKLIFIGRNLDRDALNANFRACLA